jgi:hypothetical protein
MYYCCVGLERYILLAVLSVFAPVPGPQGLPYFCDFERDICSIQQLGFPSDYFDWTRYQGPTPDVNTGPSSAYQGSWYFYTETSGTNKVNAK